MGDPNDNNEETNRANEMEQNYQINVIIESIDSSDGETEVELPQIAQPSFLYENNTPRKLHGGTNPGKLINLMKHQPISEPQQANGKLGKALKFPGKKFESISEVDWIIFKNEFGAYAQNNKLANADRRSLLLANIAGKASILVASLNQNNLTTEELIRAIDIKLSGSTSLRGREDKLRKIKQNLQDPTLINFFLDLEMEFSRHNDFNTATKIKWAYEGLQSERLITQLELQEHEFADDWNKFKDNAERLWGIVKFDASSVSKTNLIQENEQLKQAVGRVQHELMMIRNDQEKWKNNQRYNNNSYNRPTKCFNCGRIGHKSFDCKAPKKKYCKNCDMNNHNTIDCRRKPQQRREEPRENRKRKFENKHSSRYDCFIVEKEEREGRRGDEEDERKGREGRREGKRQRKTRMRRKEQKEKDEREKKKFLIENTMYKNTKTTSSTCLPPPNMPKFQRHQRKCLVKPRILIKEIKNGAKWRKESGHVLNIDDIDILKNGCTVTRKIVPLYSKIKLKMG